MTGFNLLHYPTLDLQTRLRRRWLALGLGAAWGVLLAGGCLQWQVWQTHQLRQTLQGLQTRVSEHTRQTEAVQLQRQKNQAHMAQTTGLTRLQTQQSAWTLLQSSLLEEASVHGLHLQRLQVEEDRIEVHGQAPSAQVMTRALQALSQRWGHGLHLLSQEAVWTSVTPSPELSFVWQGTWPGLSHRQVSENKAKP
jgi:hypothetical protein